MILVQSIDFVIPKMASHMYVCVTANIRPTRTVFVCEPRLVYSRVCYFSERIRSRPLQNSNDMEEGKH